MEVASESEWQAIRAELSRDTDPRADRMLTFVMVWADAAENLREKVKLGDTHQLSPIEALRDTLSEAEVLARGIMPIMEVGQALLILCSVWKPAAEDRDLFVRSMSYLERKLFVEMISLWQAHHQQQAQQQQERMQWFDEYTRREGG